jgi:hypothetical protein
MIQRGSNQNIYFSNDKLDISNSSLVDTNESMTISSPAKHDIVTFHISYTCQTPIKKKEQHS